MPTLTRVAEAAVEGCLVKPILLNFFQENQPFEFTMKMTRPLDRAPDYWFHASTHPSMPERALYEYLVHPERHAWEPMGYIGRMSTMFGTFTHEVVKAALDHLGVTVRPAGECPVCGLPRPDRRWPQAKTCNEHGGIDLETHSRGHLDAILDFKALGIFGWDLKTIKPYGLKDVPDMALEFFREKWPKYWWQCQEYMRLTGLRNFIVSFMGMGNPWDVREFHIPFDPQAAVEVEAKYRRVLAAVEKCDPSGLGLM